MKPKSGQKYGGMYCYILASSTLSADDLAGVTLAIEKLKNATQIHDPESDYANMMLIDPQDLAEALAILDKVGTTPDAKE